MADYILDVVNETSKMDWAFPFQRTGAFPLDRSSLFSSYADAVKYAAGLGDDERELGGASYVGQPISVYDADSASVTLYIINADRSLKEVGSVPTGDNLSIEVVNGAIQIHGFGEKHFEYVPAVKDEATGEVTQESSYKEVAGFKAGLEPRVILNAEGKYEIAWYEPSSETIEGVSAKVESAIKTTEALEDILNGDGTEENVGLVKEVDAVQEEVKSLGEEVDAIAEEIGSAADDVGNAATGLYKVIEDAVAAEKERAEGVESDLQDAIDTLNGGIEVDGSVAKKVADAVAAAEHLKREIFENLAAAEIAAIGYGDAADQYIYMVARGDSAEDGNHYDEYMAFKNAEGEWELERVGDWGIDLSDYAKTADVNNALDLKANVADVESALAGKVDIVEGSRLMTDAEGEKLDGIAAGAEVNFIKSVDEAQFEVSDAGHLTLLNIAQDKVTGLTDALNAKVDKVEGSRLINTEEINKLKALSIDEDGSVGISGTVNASNVQELYNAVVNIVTGEGTGEYDGAQKALLDIEAGAQVNVINSVDSEIFNITTDKKLELVEAVETNLISLGTILEANNAEAIYLLNAEEKSAVENLLNGNYDNYIKEVSEDFNVDENGKLTLVGASVLEPVIGDITQINGYEEGTTIVNEINNIYNILTWGEMENPSQEENTNG